MHLLAIGVLGGLYTKGLHFISNFFYVGTICLQKLSFMCLQDLFDASIDHIHILQ
jgi:hypothetical protein